MFDTDCQWIPAFTFPSKWKMQNNNFTDNDIHCQLCSSCTTFSSAIKGAY